MNKIKRFIAILFIIISISLIFSACGASLQIEIIGSWKRPESKSDILQFYEDGTCSLFYSSGQATYTIDSKNGLKITGFLEEPKYYVYVSPDEISATNETLFWCIDGDKLYLGNESNYFTKEE